MVRLYITIIPYFRAFRTIQRENLPFQAVLTASVVGIPERASVRPTRAGNNTYPTSQIEKLARLGWTQEEIAEVVGLHRGYVQKIAQNTEFGEMRKMLSENRSMGEAAGIEETLDLNAALSIEEALRIAMEDES